MHAPTCARTFCVHVCVRMGHMSQTGPERSLYAVRHLEQIYLIFFFFHLSGRIVLHQCDGARRLLHTHNLVCMCLFLTPRRRSDAKYIRTTSHPATPGSTAADQGHLTVTHERSRALRSRLGARVRTLSRVSSVWPDLAVHRSRSRRGESECRKRQVILSGNPPAHTLAHTRAHSHTAVPCRRTRPQSQTDFLSSA